MIDVDLNLIQQVGG